MCSEAELFFVSILKQGVLGQCLESWAQQCITVLSPSTVFHVRPGAVLHVVLDDLQLTAVHAVPKLCQPSIGHDTANGVLF